MKRYIFCQVCTRCPQCRKRHGKQGRLIGCSCGWQDPNFGTGHSVCRAGNPNCPKAKG